MNIEHFMIGNNGATAEAEKLTESFMTAVRWLGTFHLSWRCKQNTFAKWVIFCKTIETTLGFFSFLQQSNHCNICQFIMSVNLEMFIMCVWREKVELGSIKSLLIDNGKFQKSNKYSFANNKVKLIHAWLLICFKLSEIWYIYANCWSYHITMYDY